MKLLFIGDVVGKIGRDMLAQTLPKLKQLHRPQLTIVNAENAAHGRGITEDIYKELLSYGVDVMTLGNHAFDNKGIFEFIDGAKKLVRPINYPKSTVGQGYVIVQVNQLKVAIINAQGRVFMPTLNDPFEALNAIVEECLTITPHIFVDFHAEATSEKQAIGWFLDGRVSAVVGTHTHVQTNDARVLPKGTAFMCDVGMTGAYDSVLGMKIEPILEKFQTQLPNRHDVVEDGRKILSACVITIDDTTGKAKKIEPIVVSDERPLIV